MTVIDAGVTGTCTRVKEGTYTKSITRSAFKTVTLQGGWGTSLGVADPEDADHQALMPPFEPHVMNAESGVHDIELNTGRLRGGSPKP